MRQAMSDSFQPALFETQALSVGIGEKVFCQALNLTLNKGERLAILGRNGAGKSTLLSVFAGLRQPISGKVLLKGMTYAAMGARQAAQIRGWLPQAKGDAFAATVLETAMAGRHPHVDRFAWESTRDFDIVRCALSSVELSEFEQRDIQTLSGGERQRLSIATLLAQSPRLFLLDEPTTYLDLKHQIATLELFSSLARESNAAIIMVLHEPDLAFRFCDSALLVYGNGDTEIGTIHEMLTVERLSKLYQYPLQKLESNGLVSFIPG